MPKPVADAVSPDRTALRWNREQARAVVAAYEASGLSVEDFAQREGLKVARVSRWCRKLKIQPKPAIAPKFIELQPTRSMRRSERLEIILRSGHVLFVGQAFDPASLRQIVEILERDPNC